MTCDVYRKGDDKLVSFAAFKVEVQGIFFSGVYWAEVSFFSFSFLLSIRGVQVSSRAMWPEVVTWQKQNPEAEERGNSETSQTRKKTTCKSHLR